MVAARIHGLASSLHGTPAPADRITPSSQGPLIKAMDAIQDVLGSGVDESGCGQLAIAKSGALLMSGGHHRLHCFAAAAECITLRVASSPYVMTQQIVRETVIREPRWPAFVAMLAAACLYWALPEQLSVGPGWGLLAVVFALLIPTVISNRRGDYHIARALAFAANGAITLAMIASLAFLIEGLPKHRDPPQTLLRSAVALWITNVLVFALWYWKLDAGGPLGRDRARGQPHRELASSFLFPQMLVPDGDSSWSPHFMDYLFLAFNTSTAFSPTDTAALSRWAKAGMMLQSLISLSIIALLAARAVNIL